MINTSDISVRTRMKKNSTYLENELELVKFQLKTAKLWLTVKGGWCRGGIAIQFGWHCAFKLMVLWPTLELLLGSIVTTQMQASLKQLIWVMGSGFSKFSKKIPETTGIVKVAKLFLTKFWEHTICVSVKKTTFQYWPYSRQQQPRLFV